MVGFNVTVRLRLAGHSSKDWGRGLTEAAESYACTRTAAAISVGPFSREYA